MAVYESQRRHKSHPLPPRNTDRGGAEETLGGTDVPAATDDAIIETVEGNKAVGNDSNKKDTISHKSPIHNKAPQMGKLKEKFIVSRFWRLEV